MRGKNARRSLFYGVLLTLSVLGWSALAAKSEISIKNNLPQTIRVEYMPKIWLEAKGAYHELFYEPLTLQLIYNDKKELLPISRDWDGARRDNEVGSTYFELYDDTQGNTPFFRAEVTIIGTTLYVIHYSENSAHSNNPYTGSDWTWAGDSHAVYFRLKWEGGWCDNVYFKIGPDEEVWE